MGIPSPSEISLIFAGVVAAQGKLSLPLIILVGGLGSISGAHIAYFVALRGGRALILRHGQRVGLTSERLAQAETFFAKRGDLALLVGRLISGVRALVSYPAGLFRMPYPRFLLFTSIGAFLWPVIAAGAGYLVGPHWQQLVVWLERVWIVLLVALAGGIALYVVARRRHGQQT